MGPKELGLSHVNIWRKRDPSRGKIRHTGPVVGMSKLSAKPWVQAP